MGKYNYNDIVKKAEYGQKNLKKEYKLHLWSWWCYYFAKIILGQNKGKKLDIAKITIKFADKPKTTSISRQIPKKDYLDMCSRLIKSVEKNKKLPNSIYYKVDGKTYTVPPLLFTEILSRVVLYYKKNKALPNYVNANHKVFTPKLEHYEEVYNYYVKKTGKKPSTIDEILTYIKGKGYGGYYDDKLSNFQVIDSFVNSSKQNPNCVDALQFLINMAKKLGYETKCIHVSCRQSGTGHVFGKFRHKKHTGNKWIVRDPASVVDGNSIYSVWCENGYVQATNPSWFLENLNR